MSDGVGNKRLATPVMLFAVLGIVITLATGCGAEKSTGNGTENVVNSGTRLQWPVVYYDIQRDGRSPVNGPTTAGVRWTFAGGTTSRSSWAVVGKDGSILSGFPGKVVSLDVASGAVAWEFAVGASHVTSCRVGEDGTIYVGTDTSVVALSSSGKQMWSYDIGSTVDSPALADDGTVYAGSTGGRLVALSKDGKLKWEFRAPGNVRSPSIDRSGNLYCSASTLAMYCLDNKGKKKWEFKPAGDLPQYTELFDWSNTLDIPSIAADGTIYAGTFVTPGITKAGQQIPGYNVPLQGKIYAITPQGQLKWEYTHAGAPMYTIHTPTIGSDGTLYAGTSCWIVVALDPTGKVVWEFDTNEGTNECPSVYSPPIGKDGLLYAATTNSRIYCITPDGKEKWRYDANNPWLPGPEGQPMMGGSNNFTPPAITKDGTLVSLLAEGKIFAFKTAVQPK
jgi:outer membrane protein assembly factor BamB